jgi:amino-acid N-acetyltransferase
MIRKSTIQDLKKVQELINFYAKQDKMLPRSLSELYDNARDFFVYEDGDGIAGCCALHITWDDLAEVRSLAVAEEKQKHNIGTALVRAAIEDAKKLNVKKVFALTYVPEFFERFGFKRVDHSQLPHKIWSDCIKCVKFPDCQEIALIMDIA